MYHTPPRSPIVVNCGLIQKAEPTAPSAHPAFFFGVSEGADKWLWLDHFVFH